MSLPQHEETYNEIRDELRIRVKLMFDRVRKFWAVRAKFELRFMTHNSLRHCSALLADDWPSMHYDPHALANHSAQKTESHNWPKPGWLWPIMAQGV